MRILLDECIDEGMRFAFTGHHCQSCRYAGLKGLSNGRLLSAAEEAGFDVMITVDQNMEHQQSLRGRAISLIILQASSTNLEDLQVLLPEVLGTLETLRPGEVVRIGDRSQR